MTARRCSRGHFIPADADTTTCRCTLTPRRRYRFAADIWGQGLAARRIRTIWPTGSYL